MPLTLKINHGCSWDQIQHCGIQKKRKEKKQVTPQLEIAAAQFRCLRLPSKNNKKKKDILTLQRRKTMVRKLCREVVFYRIPGLNFVHANWGKGEVGEKYHYSDCQLSTCNWLWWNYTCTLSCIDCVLNTFLNDGLKREVVHLIKQESICWSRLCSAFCPPDWTQSRQATPSQWRVIFTYGEVVLLF